MQLYRHVVKEVESLPEGPHIGAFFDFDGTIIYGYSATEFLREQLRRGDIKITQIPEVLATATRFGMGNMDFSGLMTETASMLTGKKETEYVEFGKKLYRERLAKRIYPESRSLIEAHLKKGHTVALVSAAMPYQVEAAAADLGIQHVVCTHLEIQDGRFTGEVLHPTCYGMGKVVAAEKIAKAEGVDLSQSFFYTDSDEDIQLLEAVGNPRPLNPNSRLRGIANGRGWPVQEFSSRGKTGIVDVARTLGVQGSMVGSALAGIPIYALTRSLRKSRNFSMGVFADLASAIAGLELEVTGEEHLWSNRPAVFIFNHQSQVDVLIIARLLRRDMAGVGKKEIGNIPVLGKVIQLAGTILIDRENSRSAVEAMRPLVDAMRNEGRSVTLAPEGTRSTSTNLGPFKKGAFHLAMQAEVPIVPIVIHNAVDAGPRGQFATQPATVHVTVLPPVDTSDWTAKNMDKQVEYVRDMYLVELDQMVLQRPALPSSSPSTTAESMAAAKKAAVDQQAPAKKTSSFKKSGMSTRRRKASATKVSARQTNTEASEQKTKTSRKKRVTKRKVTKQKAT